MALTQMVLSPMLIVPALGIVAVLVTPRSAERVIRITGNIITGLICLMSFALLWAFRPQMPQIQFEEQVAWIPSLNISYHLGVDGLSMPMIVLTGLLSFLACLASGSIKERIKEYYALYLLLVLGMLGTFLSLDLFLFYVFWEVVLVPMYFLIGIWGGGRREYSAFKFFVYTLAGSLFMLLAVLALYFRAGTFDMLALRQVGHTLPAGLQWWLFLGFFLGFAVKVPVFPFHTWLPDAHVDAPTPISVLLAGVLLKMGGYGFFRISYPILPHAAQMFATTMAVLGMVNIIYGALVAMAQTDFKRLVAYSSVSHMGFVLLGLASLTSVGMNGAMLQMFNHGIITGGMFLLVGVLYDRAHTRELSAFGGLGVRMPVYSGFLIFFSLASLGLPGMAGFVSEFMALVGTFEPHRVATSLSVIGIVVAAAYMLMVMQRVLLGPLNEKWAALPDMTPRERWTLIPLMAIVLAIGIYPLLALQFQDAGVQALVDHVEQAGRSMSSLAP